MSTCTTRKGEMSCALRMVFTSSSFFALPVTKQMQCSSTEHERPSSSSMGTIARGGAQRRTATASAPPPPSAAVAGSALPAVSDATAVSSIAGSIAGKQ
jgi:hypothetical protein